VSPASPGLGLAALARASVAAALGRGPEPTPKGERGAPAATFVTIRKAGRLRGCVGTTEPRHALLDDVALRARAAALSDPRFPPVTAAELDELEFEVSVLTAPEPLPARDFDEACRSLRPYRDGVIIEVGGHRALFLPQVWEQLPAAADFLDALWAKAGLPVRYFPARLRLWVFSVEKHGERGTEAPR
jgi:AmmeMemoRadiSam system protein A